MGRGAGIDNLGRLPTDDDPYRLQRNRVVGDSVFGGNMPVDARRPRLTRAGRIQYRNASARGRIRRRVAAARFVQHRRLPLPG